MPAATNYRQKKRFQMANINKVLETVYEYLESNGFSRKENNVSGKAFQKDDKLVLIYGDTVSFRECSLDGEEIDYPEFAHCTGTEAWDLKAWKEILDAYKIVPITFQLKIHMNRNHQSNEWIGDRIENFFGNVKTLMLLLLTVSGLLFFTSCNTQRQVQMRTGNISIQDGHFYFMPTARWTAIPSDTTFPAVQVKNTSVRKQDK